MTLERSLPAASVFAASQWLLIAAALLALQAACCSAMGRLPICACGYVKLWHGAVQSSENSQHIADWYTLSHILHGLLFYGATWLACRGALAGAPDRRDAGRGRLGTGGEFRLDHRPIPCRHVSLDYYGDSIVNSVSDTLAMVAAFCWREAAGRRHRRPRVLFELVMLLHIRDNLALNIIMLIHPFEAIRQWQAGPPII